MAKTLELYATNTPPGPVTLLDSKRRPQSIIGKIKLTFSMWSIDADRPRTDVYRDVDVTAVDDGAGTVNWPIDWVLKGLAPGTYICKWDVTFAGTTAPKSYPRPSFQRVVILSPQAG